MKRSLLLMVMFIGIISLSYGQKTITGVVTSDSEGELIGATVIEKGTSNGTVTDFDGSYEISVSGEDAILVFSYVGYTDKEMAVAGLSTIDAVMVQGQELEQVVVTGSRAPGRTNTDSPVPVDVINISKLTSSAPQTDLNDIMAASAPSFSSNKQTISDGTDHIDPASLRGLGPDQVLVLVNGKRRHNTSLVNVNGTFGRGNVGTDLSAIPAAAISNIEVLRDGAAAQYGSDAIAGVINLQLRKNVNKLTLNASTGAHFTSNIGPFGGETKTADGEVVNFGANYGLPLGDKGGYVNLTGELTFRGATSRMQDFSGGIFNRLNSVERVARSQGVLDVTNASIADIQGWSQSAGFSSEVNSQIQAATDIETIRDLMGADNTAAELAARGQQSSDYNMRVGQSQVRGGKFFGNLSIPFGDDGELYSFGGVSYRTGESGCFYRLPSQNRTVTAIYPDGHVPLINSNIVDQSIAVGLRNKIKEWHVDLSNTYGSNSFDYFITETANATSGGASPTEFNAGGHTFTQNTANLDFSRYFENPGAIKGINVAFGAEFRMENYVLRQGSERSYANYDINSELVTPTTPDNLLVRDFLGRNRPNGCQCFAGFLPSNEIDAFRSSYAAYFDSEFDISDAFLITGALRFEDYSDFGSTFNYKVSTRLKASESLSLRGAISSGFRAPSLHQINFSRTSTIFEVVNGVSVAQEVGTFSNGSRVARLVGIEQLTQETSQNYSAGITAKLPHGFKITLDGFLVDIKDRVVLTGTFGPGNVSDAGERAELQALFNLSGATEANFFANAVDTRTTGIDFVISNTTFLKNDYRLSNDLALTYAATEVQNVKFPDRIVSAGLQNNYFDETSRIYLERAVPRFKAILTNTLDLDKFSFFLRNTYYGETTEATNELNPPVYSGKVLTDLSVGYKIAESVTVTVGANNLFDIYPDEAPESFQSSGRFPYTRRSPQFGFNGRFVFARVGLSF